MSVLNDSIVSRFVYVCQVGIMCVSIEYDVSVSSGCHVYFI